MSCKGLHCDGCHGSGGGGIGALVALLVIIALGLRAAWPHVVRGAEIAAWVVAGIAGAAVVVTGTVLAVRAVRWYHARRPARQVPACHVTILPPERPAGSRTLGQPSARPAISAARRPLSFGVPEPQPRPGRLARLRQRMGGDLR
jgi:hypothetical protein